MIYEIQYDKLGIETIRFYSINDLNIYQKHIWLEYNQILILDHITDNKIMCFIEKRVDE